MMRIEEFTFTDKVTEEQRAWYRLRLAQAAENPDRREPEIALADHARQARYAGPHEPRRRHLLARAGDEVVGSAELIAPVVDNTHMAGVGLYVVARHRRRGVATALMAEALKGLRDEGRDILWVGAVRMGTPGEKAAAALGLSPTYEYVRQLLEIRGTDPDTWRAELPEGFRLELWIDAAPEAHIESYAQARNAIATAPAQRSVFKYPTWTPERIREQERRLRRLGEMRPVMAAIHERTGDVAAITELSLHAADAKHLEQQYTAVRPDYRRRGLALCVKGALMRWLVAHHPHARTVMTGTAADNAGMIAVNERLGYRTVGAWTNYEADLAQVEARLAVALGRGEKQ